MFPKRKKRPHCRTCGAPMLGHKRQQCSSGPLASLPPVSPPKPRVPRTSDLTPDPSPSVKDRESSFVIPDPTPLRSPSPIPFLLTDSEVDDKGTVIDGMGSDSDDKEEGDDKDVDGSSATYSVGGDNDDEEDPVSPPFDHTTDLLAHLGEPIVAIYIIKREDFPKIHDAAAMHAHHTSIIQTPRKIVASAKKQSSSQPKSEQPDVLLENSCWLVIGQNAELVQHIVDSQQREMPGTIEEVPCWRARR